MKVSLREDVCASTDYELSVEQDGLVLSNKRETMNLRNRDMDRFWFRHFGSTAVAFVIEMSGMVYEGNFLKPASPGSKFCMVCGTPIQAASAPPPAAPRGAFCLNCGAPLKPGDKFCMKCGAKV